METRQGGRVNRKVLGNQKGFTLIEIIIVMVLLGILSATVAPKYLDLQTDARKASLDGLTGGLKAAGSIVYTACLISATCNEKIANAGDATTQVVVGGTTIDVNFGWPTAAEITEAAGVTLGKFTEAPAGTYTIQTDCKVVYTAPAAEGANATVTITNTGC